MSHTVAIQTEVRDPAAVQAACRRLGLTSPQQGTHRLFSGEATGLAVQLPAWRYPVVCDLSNGKTHYDNFGGRWGEQQQLDRFIQAYAVEMAKLQSRRAGHTVTEQTLPDGSIKLTVQVEGGAT